MHQFKISITPIHAKRFELFQTLESLMSLYRPYCEDISLSESKRLIIILGKVNDLNQLQVLVESKEYEVLTGALSLLAAKTDFQIKGIHDMIQFEKFQKSIIRRNFKPSQNE
jgi:hypothetical protein